MGIAKLMRRPRSPSSSIFVAFELAIVVRLEASELAVVDRLEASHHRRGRCQASTLVVTREKICCRWYCLRCLLSAVVEMEWRAAWCLL